MFRRSFGWRELGNVILQLENIGSDVVRLTKIMELKILFGKIRRAILETVIERQT